jgi:hypothetical protein
MKGHSLWHKAENSGTVAERKNIVAEAREVVRKGNRGSGGDSKSK